ncbi:hypothetical protein NDU88_001799 [Pleurodeles waltl]|uniref:Uncharacterized protein n=1 Tax=Pleurodeles waltl TaxID=8319 RepID=A0AAV7MPR6_PLEWA|nr:hypothetical protein NDU88_001799 [Pleurodeles waltl]
MIIGTDYDEFPALLNNANQKHMTESWWMEAPFVSTEIEQHTIQRKPSKKEKREQKKGYQRQRDNTDPKAIMSVAGGFCQAQTEDPTLKNAWHNALAPDGASTLRSEPSYPWGTADIGIPDPDVLRTGPNQQQLLGNGRQQQQLRAFPRIKRGDGDDREKVADGESTTVERDGEEQPPEDDDFRGGDTRFG